VVIKVKNDKERDLHKGEHHETKDQLAPPTLDSDRPRRARVNQDARNSKIQTDLTHGAFRFT